MNTRDEKWLYVENSRSQQFVLLYILGNTLFIILYVNNMNVDLDLGLFVLFNIALTLFAFLMAVRQKVYDLIWGYAGLALAAYQVFRMLWIPAEIEPPLRLFLQGLLLVTGVLLFVGSLICIRRSKERRQYIVDNNVDVALLQK